MTTETTATTASNPPSFIAYQVRDVDGEKNFWTRIGAAWSHTKGVGFTIQLTAIPLDGRIILRAPSEKPE